MSNKHECIDKDFSQDLIELTLIPSFETFEFESTMLLHFTVLTDKLKKITLNQYQLEIHNANIMTESLAPIPVEHITKDDDNQIVSFESTTDLTKGKKYILEVKYKGQHNDKLKGWYRAKYKDPKGVEKQMLTTQMEPYYCRMVVPCVDEPEWKTVFRVSVTVGRQQNVLSNMPELISNTLNDGKKTVLFEDTPKMSTQLFAIIIGQFDYVQTQTKRGTLIKTYTPQNQSSKGVFANECARRTLELQEDWFQLDQPLPKLEQVAISEFEAGAMENWGLVTQRETDLLIDSNSSIRQKDRVALVVCHELAHQWFGNLVTMKWWNDLWLNESFATQIECLCTHTLFPEFDHMDQFVGDQMLQAMSLDSLKSSHPIDVPINKVQEVDEIFDAISQCKGCAILRMFDEFMGREVFLKGLRSQFIKYKYGNASKEDLFACWNEASGKDIASKMQCWINQMGQPLVEIISEKFDGLKATFKLRQTWYLENGEKDQNGKKWFIPLQINVGGKEVMYEMNELEEEMTLDLASPNDQVKFNSEGKTQCRVKQMDESLSRLKIAIKERKLGVPDKSSVLSDTRSFLKSGVVDQKYLFEILGSFEGETQSETIDMILTALGATDIQLKENEEAYPYQCRQVYNIIHKLYFELGVEKRPEDSNDQLKLRTTLIQSMERMNKNLGELADKTLAPKLDAMFQKILKSPNENGLPSEAMGQVIRNYLRSIDTPEKFNDVKDLYSKFISSRDKCAILGSLGAMSPIVQDIAIKWVYEEVELQDHGYGVSSLANSKYEGWLINKKQFEENQDKIALRVGEAHNIMIDLFFSTYGSAYKDEDVKEIQEQFDKCNQRQDKTYNQIKEKNTINNKMQNMIKKSEIQQVDQWKKLLKID